jgi:hypothetical protein
VFLNRSKVVYRSVGIAPVKSERRHIAVNGRQAFLQALSEIVIVKLIFAESSKWRGVNVWALARSANGVTAPAHGFEPGLCPLLFAIPGITGVPANTCHEKHEAEFRRFRSF